MPNAVVVRVVDVKVVIPGTGGSPEFVPPHAHFSTGRFHVAVYIPVLEVRSLANSARSSARRRTIIPIGEAIHQAIAQGIHGSATKARNASATE